MKENATRLWDELTETYIKTLPSNYDEQIKSAYEKVSQYPRSTLVCILRAFNNWDWPEVLGDPPVKNWDELPEYRRPWMPEGTLVKKDFIKPYMDALLVLGIGPRDTNR